MGIFDNLTKYKIFISVAENKIYLKRLFNNEI